MESFSARLRNILMIAAGVALLALMLLATLNVALRVFRAPVGGAYEIVSFLGAIVTAGALGYTQKRKDHIVVDILSEKFPAPVRRVLNGISYAVLLVLFTIVAWQTYVYGRRLMETGELSETLKIAYYPFVFLTALGFAAMALTLFLDLVGTFMASKEEPR